MPDMNKFTRRLAVWNVLLTVFCLSFTTSIYSQDKYNDSLQAKLSTLQYNREWPLLEPKIKAGKASAIEWYKAAHLRREQVDESIGYLNSALKLEQKGSDLYAVILFSRSFAYKRRSNYQLELKDLEMLVTTYPGFKLPLLNLSFLLMEEHDYRRAIELGQRLLKLEPGNIGAHNNLAYGYAESGQYREAVSIGEKGLKLRGDIKVIAALNNNIGYARAMLGDHKKGLEEIQESIRKNPSNPFAYFNKGRIYIELKQNGLACAAFRQAREYGGVNLTALYLEKYCK